MKRTVVTLWMSGCMLWCIAGCTGTTNLAGGTVETSNGYVTGKVFAQDGSPAAGTMVMVIPGTFNPLVNRLSSDAQIDTTDSSGTYRCSVVESGIYTIEAVRLTDMKKAMITGIAVRTSDSITVTPAALRPTGAIMVTIGDNTVEQNGYVYLQGTTFFAVVRNGLAVMTGIPAGATPPLLRVLNNDSVSSMVQSSVDVVAGDTVFLADYHTWKYSKRVVLNSSTSGAGVAGTVTGFPVLVRLTAGNFTFSQARGKGEDIRFTKSNSMPLSYQVERWDSSGQTAEIWVRIDTVFGNNGTQYINLFWGNRLAPSESSGPAVFDTAEGFVAVYHLGEASGNAVDASANSLNGYVYGGLQYGTSGNIGLAPSFNGTGSYLDAGNSDKFAMSSKNGFTVSAWVKRAGGSVSGAHEGIAGKYNWVGGPYREYVLSNDPDNGFMFEISGNGMDTSANGETNLYANVIPANDKWYYVVGVKDSATMKIFINGNEKNSTAKTKIFGSSLSTFKIGLIDDDNALFRQYFNGNIDEVVVANTNRSADWIKLCFENQRIGQNFVTLSPP
jgi:hypothetical protein